jgi:hypothetical protein
MFIEDETLRLVGSSGLRTAGTTSEAASMFVMSAKAGIQRVDENAAFHI